METLDNNAGTWNLKTEVTYLNKDLNYNYEWTISGSIKSNYVFDNQTAVFGGLVKTKIKNKECKFTGEVNIQNANLLWNFMGTVTSPMDKEITLPRGAFSNMFIKNIIFKDSNFFNDFDKYVFEGLNGVKSIAFLSCKLEIMPKMDDFLQSFINLQEIYFEDCTTPNLKFGFKATLKNVRSASFKGTGPLYFDEYSFQWLSKSNVTFLNLKNSYIKLSPNANSVLTGINHSLSHLDISHSNLKSENDLTILLNDLNINYLVAEDLNLKKIPTGALGKVKYTLKYLSLRGSNFGKILETDIFSPIFKFPPMFNLIELNLMNCQINYLERGSFDSLPNLKKLYLGNNNLENLQDGWSVLKPRITHLDLSGNGLTLQIPYLKTMATTLNLTNFTELKFLNLSNGIFLNTKNVIKSIGENLEHLSLRNADLFKVPRDIFEKLNNLQILDLSFNKNIKPLQTLSINLFNNMKNLKKLILTGCRINNLSNQTISGIKKNPLFENLTVLDLSYNNVKLIESSLLKSLPKLEILNLSGNGLTSWKKNLFSNNQHLKELFLDENKIDVITEDMLEELKKLKIIKMGNNPYVCGPYVYDIVNMMSEKKTCRESFYAMENSSFCDDEKLNIIDWSENSFVCFSRSKNKLIPFTKVNETFQNILENGKKNGNLNLFTIFFIVGLVITLAIVFWKISDIHLIGKAVKNAVALSFLSRGNNESDNIRNYEYNVFVSYSDKDRTWVINNLIPRLESNRDVKVCLHERDFQAKNIIASIDSSCNIVLVLSKSFLKSQWCQYEMLLAQHRLLETGRDQLILVLLENIPVVKRPKTLRYLMMTKTYLEWPVKPKNTKEIDIFWNRLLKSLKI
ncbi:conserved hypothetical protein [Pediculus humanus corporis]|uniref:TIR domain-containing protein n=1 Tax=Pediculus humanus subsp. corporis TaxID=121224 RepID=E0V9A2_PEDHC|nr:uncharacterized protein Phum_PHUM006690 [Pediculus humanus corporis]EEB09958.1 conserved hypothetical protein [Pediculus humanus corporis]